MNSVCFAPMSFLQSNVGFSKLKLTSARVRAQEPGQTAGARQFVLRTVPLDSWKDLFIARRVSSSALP